MNSINSSMFYVPLLPHLIEIYEILYQTTAHKIRIRIWWTIKKSNFKGLKLYGAYSLTTKVKLKTITVSYQKDPNIYKLSNTLLNNLWIIEKIHKRKYF